MSNKTKFVKGNYPWDLKDICEAVYEYYNEAAPEKVSLESFLTYCTSKKVDVLISEGTIKCNWASDPFIDNAIQLKDIKARVEPLEDFPL